MRLYENQPSGTGTRARNLRRNATDAEKKLLRTLREAFPERKWRAQVPIGPYFADILCFSEKLVIEIDGGQHADAAAYDEQRTRFIECQGFHVLRIWNTDVMQNIDGVLTQISFSLWEKKGPMQSMRRMRG